MLLVAFFFGGGGDLFALVVSVEGVGLVLGKVDGVVLDWEGVLDGHAGWSV